MNRLVFFAVSVCFATGQDYYHHPQRASRRQGVSYSMSVIHPPDKNFLKPKSPRFEDSNPTQAISNVFAYQRPNVQNFAPNLRHQTSFPTDSQLFNVGYSVSFANDPKRTAKRVESPDIITGSRKETVSRPNQIGFESQDYAFLDSKKQKLSGIKPKLRYPTTYTANTNALLSQANLSPKTQKFLADLEKIKTTSAPQLAKGSWHNLSPSVEIYHSKEIGHNYRFNPADHVRQAQSFDHAGALGRSQGFDYSNVLEMEKNARKKAHDNLPKSNLRNFYNVDVPNVEYVPQRTEIVESGRKVPVVAAQTSPLKLDTSRLPNQATTVNLPNPQGVTLNTAALEEMQKQFIQQFQKQTPTPTFNKFGFNFDQFNQHTLQLQHPTQNLQQLQHPTQNLQQLQHQAHNLQGFQGQNLQRLQEQGQQNYLLGEQNVQDQNANQDQQSHAYQVYEKFYEQPKAIGGNFANEAVRQPRINSRVRSMVTDLRPPPMIHVRNRRMHV